MTGVDNHTSRTLYV